MDVDSIAIVVMMFLGFYYVVKALDRVAELQRDVIIRLTQCAESLDSINARVYGIALRGQAPYDMSD